MKNLKSILTDSEVAYQPVSNKEVDCKAVFRAAAHFRFLAGTSAEERAAMGYDARDWHDFFEATQCPTRRQARIAGVQTAIAILG